MNHANFKIHFIKTFQDNYVWIIAHQNNKALIVDPGDATPVKKWLMENHIQPIAILLTHHHWDHANGVAELVEDFKIPVYGNILSKENLVTHPVKNEEKIDFPEIDIQFEVIFAPGHTLDHILFFSKKDKLLFCGDTLFSAGCGRLFEGKAEQLYEALEKIKSLPDDTKIYCAHEYTLANLKFALFVDPDNSDIIRAIEKAKRQREEHLPTLPSTLAIEKKINPFLRCDQNSIKTAVKNKFDCYTKDALEVFTLLRKWKDEFKG